MSAIFDNPVLLAALVTAVFGLIGVGVTAFAARSGKRTDAKTALDARIDARVKEQLEDAWKRLDAADVRERQWRADQVAAEAEHTRREHVTLEYVRSLRRHIVRRLSPPPPELPAELYDWHDDLGDDTEVPT